MSPNPYLSHIIIKLNYSISPLPFHIFISIHLFHQQTFVISQSVSDIMICKKKTSKIVWNKGVHEKEEGFHRYGSYQKL